jgi:hypothetical protein
VADRGFLFADQLTPSQGMAGPDHSGSRNALAI